MEQDNINTGQEEKEEISSNPQEKLPLKRKYEIDYLRLFIFISLVLIVVALFFILTKDKEDSINQNRAEIEKVENVELDISMFEDLIVDGKAAYIWDIKNKKSLYKFNEETQLPLASLTKLMTIYTAANLLEPENVVTIKPNSLLRDGDSGLFAFENWKFKDLTDFTLVVSSNDGAGAIASAAGAIQLVNDGDVEATPEEAFVSEMNNISNEIGLTQTYFVNETGLDPNQTVSGGYGSVKDVALLMEHILKTNPDIMSATVRSSFDVSSDNFIHTATNTNKVIGKIPGLIASKTGFTELAGGNLVVAFDAGINRPVVIAVLGSTIDGRFDDIEKLVNATLAFITQ